jgi:hypothetical protein
MTKAAKKPNEADAGEGSLGSFLAWLKRYGDFILFFLIACIGLVFIGSTMPHTWNITGMDPADYVYLAKHFWGVPQQGVQFVSDFNVQWRHFLSIIPFRQIGTGTFYLMMRIIFGSRVDQLGPFVLNALIAFSYAWLSYLWGIRTKRIFGWICLGVLLITTTTQTTGYLIWSEPLLRICFVCGFALFLLRRQGESFASRRMVAGFFLIFLVMANIKIQWMVFGLVLMLCQMIILACEKNWRRLCATLCLALLIPLSIFMINGLGWDYWGLVGGNSLHTMFQPGGGSPDFLAAICQKEEMIQLSTRFCNEGVYSFPTWGEFMKFQYPQQNIRQMIQTMDGLSKQMINYSPSADISTLVKYAPDFTNFPLSSPPFLAGLLISILDGLGFIICLLGLYFPRTRMVALFCLGSWSIPLLGAHVAAWDPRYLTPMAGIPLLGAVYILSSLLWPDMYPSVPEV